MKTIGIIGLLVLLAGATATWFAAGQAGAADRIQLAQDSSDELMQMKLEQSKILLEALTLEDYERIGTTSERLKDISNQARWTQPHSERYGIYGDEFRTTLTRMGDNALAKNLDGVTLNFMQMVATCVECHKVVRGAEQIALAPGFGDTARFFDAQLETSGRDVASLF